MCQTLLLKLTMGKGSRQGPCSQGLYRPVADGLRLHTKKGANEKMSDGEKTYYNRVTG